MNREQIIKKRKKSTAGVFPHRHLCKQTAWGFSSELQTRSNLNTTMLSERYQMPKATGMIPITGNVNKKGKLIAAEGRSARASG